VTTADALLAAVIATPDDDLVRLVYADYAEEIRRNWPFFRDRRIDHYAGITKRVADGTGG